MARDDPILFVRALDIAEDLPDGRILSFEFTDEERKADQVKITIDNSGLDFYDDEILRKGGIIAFGFGVDGLRSPLRSAVITSIKGPILSPVVEAKALSILMATKRRRRVFENITRSELVEQIADENGFDDQFRFVDETTRRFESVSQANESDAALLARLARKEGFEFYVDHTGFHWHERNLDQTPVRTLVFSGGDRGDFIGIPVIDNDVTAKPGRVRVKTRDPTTKESDEGRSDNSTDDSRSGLAPILEVVPPEGGDTFLLRPDTRKQLGQTVQAIARVGEFVSETALRVITLNPNLELRLASEDPVRATRADDASSESRAMYRRAQRTAVKLSGVIHGDPLIGAKQIVRIEGLGRKFTGLYYVKQAVHTLSRSGGYTTKIRVVSDGHGGHSTTGSSRFDLGRVTGRPSRSSRSPRRPTSEEVAAALARFTDVARFSGTNTLNVFAAAARAEATFRDGGTDALGDVRDALAAAREGARVFQVDKPGLLQAALQVQSVVNRAAGGEVLSGAQVNRKEAAEVTTRLEEFERVSPEGDSAVEYRPPGGNKSR